jgi:predicted Zn-dependent protease with MMP-like domain
MTHVSDEQFLALVEEAVAAIPERFSSHLDNLAFMVANVPTPEQEVASGALHGRSILLGLYEGIPLPRRSGGGYSGVLPDVITVFKYAHEQTNSDIESLRKAVKQTVWHEVAHYFGLNHGQIRALEKS